MNALRATMKNNLYKIITLVDLLVSSIKNVTAKAIRNCTVPVAIIAATKEKKMELETLMRASAKKGSFRMAKLSLHAY